MMRLGALSMFALSPWRVGKFEMKRYATRAIDHEASVAASLQYSSNNHSRPTHRASSFHLSRLAVEAFSAHYRLCFVRNALFSRRFSSLIAMRHDMIMLCDMSWAISTISMRLTSEASSDDAPMIYSFTSGRLIRYHSKYFNEFSHNYYSTKLISKSFNCIRIARKYHQ